MDMLSNPRRQSAAENLVGRIKDLTPDKEKLSTPSVELIKLPFPTLSIRKPTDRFAFDTDRNWEYMPRRKFGELLHQVEALIEQPDRASAIWLYGTSANNQSYLTLNQKQLNLIRVNTFGGMTKVIKYCP
jgi:hypothetical protein